MAFQTFCRKLTQSLTIAIGLFVATGVLTLMFWPEARPSLSHVLAFVPMILAFCCAWGIICVAIARKAGWSAQRGAGLAVGVASVAYFVALFVNSKPPTWGGFSVTLWWFCRKVLYSESEWKAVAPAEPLTTLHLNS